MSDKWNPVTKKFESGASTSFKGSRAGESFESGSEQEEKSASEEFAKMKGATGIAGASKRSTPQYKTEYAAWRKKRATASGQKKAVSEEKKVAGEPVE